MRRVGIFGWGVVAPRSTDIDEFASNLEAEPSWLEPFDGFGPDNFLVGVPKFDFSAYRPWIDARFPPNRFRQLVEKMDPTTLFAVGGFIQALRQNAGIEQALQELGTAAHVYVATGLGSLPSTYDISVKLYRAQRRWNRFWAAPERNAALRAHLAGDAPAGAEAPQDPSEVSDPDAREVAEDAFNAYWAARSEKLAEFLAELRDIEAMRVEGDVETGKLKVIREKRRRLDRLAEKWRAPEPPWAQVSANLLWNISNTPASQISMLGKITGLAFAPVAACATFGVALKLAIDAIQRGDAKAVVMGATDPPPHPLSVGTFYSARVLSADRSVSKPLTELRGTHVSGGSAIWIVGDHEYFTARGFKPLGMERVSVGTSADADHIITPSEEGPRQAIQQALRRSGVSLEQIGSWDLHATATPGDFQEVENLRHVLPENVLFTARKGTFGHGMAVAGGWELTAQYLGCERRQLFPTPLREDELNGAIRALHERFVFNRPVEMPTSAVGKLSMGVGGINACVISRPWT